MKRPRDNNWKQPSRRDRFSYVPLNTALKSVGKKFNLIGIVKDFKIPRASSGPDKFIVIRIADESHESPGIPLTVFGSSFDDLPLVMSPGDIIIVSRVKMQRHGGIVTADYHKQYSSFALYEGRHGTNFNHYQASSNFDQALRKEQHLITELRTWLVNFQPATYNLKMIRDMEENQTFSFVGLILRKQVYQGRWIIYFWDGSNAPPLSIKSRLDDESGNLVKLQSEPEPLSRDVLITLPHSGTVLRITLREADMHMSGDFLRVGQYVNLDGLKCEAHDDMWAAVLLGDTSIRYVQEDNPPQLHCQRCNFGQGSPVSEEMVGCCISPPTEITEVDPAVDVPLISLHDALACSAVDAEFKCIVRVVAVFPWPIEDFVSTDRVRLTLEDPTARIHALLCGEDGEYFLNGLVGNNLRSKLKLLVGVDDEHECSGNPPWVICCLKYSDNPSGSREYKISGPKLRS